MRSLGSIGRSRKKRRDGFYPVQTLNRLLDLYYIGAAVCFAVCAVIVAYWVWFLGVGNDRIAEQQMVDAAEFNTSLVAPAPPLPAAAPPVAPTEPETPATPPVPVVVAPGNAEDFATLYVPRFGEAYVRLIAEGTGVTDVLNKGRVGHYAGTATPGAVGNFGVAAHRSAYGGAFHNMPALVPGDLVFVKTAEGWFTYSYTEQRVVQPSEVSVLAPVPGEPGAVPTERMLTMTTCDPLYSDAERIAAFARFVSWQPLSAGAPAGVPAAALAASEG